MNTATASIFLISLVALNWTPLESNLVVTENSLPPITTIDISASADDSDESDDDCDIVDVAVSS